MKKKKYEWWNSRKELVKIHPIRIFSIQSKEKNGKVIGYSKKNNKDKNWRKSKKYSWKKIYSWVKAKSNQSKSAANNKNALSFPLTSVSLPLASADGVMRKTKISDFNCFTLKSQHIPGKLNWWQVFICRCSCDPDSSKKCTKDVRRFSN